jgi:hypothetical protein
MEPVRWSRLPALALAILLHRHPAETRCHEAEDNFLDYNG